MLAVSLGHVKIGERQYLFRLAMMTYPLYLLHSVLGKMIFEHLNLNRYLSLAIVASVIFITCYILAMYVDRPLNKYVNIRLSSLYSRLRSN